MTKPLSHDWPAPGREPQPSTAFPSEADDPQRKLQQLLADIWERSRQMEIDRVEILREAQLLACAGRLDDPACQKAMEAAHKLAGALGTFGLPHGTELARQIEAIFRKGVPDRKGAERLHSVIEELSLLVHSAGPRQRASEAGQ